MSIAFCNGSWVLEDQAVVPLNDRGFLFGDGVFTTIRVQGGVPQCLQAHLERIRLHCFALKIIPPAIDPAWITDIIHRNKAQSGVWRLKIIVTGGDYKELRLPPRPHGKLIMLLNPYQEKLQEARLTLYPHPILRPVSLLKTLSYLDRLWIAEYASQQGYDDAVVLSPEGYVLETSFSNLFWQQGEEYYIPDPSLPFLFGVALGVVEQSIRKMGCGINYIKAKPESLTSEVQMYMCNALRGIVPVRECFGRHFKTDQQSQESLRKAYTELSR